MVFYLSLLIVLLFVLWGFLNSSSLAYISNNLLTITIDKFGWFYLFAMFGFLVFSLFLAFSKYGKIRLGKDEDRPEYSNLTWFSMLFSAGMGIGLVFWGVAEPIDHFINPPMDIAARTPEAGAVAMRYTFFHWGLHPWAVYTVIALGLAYFGFRKGHRGLISSTFYPLIGEKRTKGYIGKSIDILAVIATAFGVATSLGLGALQINGGLNHIFKIPNNITNQIIIIAIVTVLYMISATTGLDRGIKILSNINVIIATFLFLSVLFMGPTSFIIDTLTVTIGGYLQNLIQMSFRLTPFTQEHWIGQWTLFYWAWWISWAPFVGTFIARVSKGRTIREFVLGVLFVPSIASFLWFSAFGGTALNFEMFKGFNIGAAVQNDVTTALFITLEKLPLGTVISLIAILLIITFFITSADSATFVLGMLTSKGSLDPSVQVKFIWGFLQSTIAIVLLFSGGLDAIQKMAIIIALPFAIIMVLMCFSMVKAFREEKIKKYK